jgi:hypothetical protein
MYFKLLVVLKGNRLNEGLEPIGRFRADNDTFYQYLQLNRLQNSFGFDSVPNFNYRPNFPFMCERPALIPKCSGCGIVASSTGYPCCLANFN